MAETGTKLALEDSTQLLRLLEGIKGQYEALDKDYSTLGKASSETTEKLKKLTDDVVMIQTKYSADAVSRMDAIEAKMRELPSAPTQPKSIGEVVTEDKGFLEHGRSGNRGAYVLTLKSTLPALRKATAITGVSTTWGQTLPDISVGPRVPAGVRVLVPSGMTTAGSIDYMRETAAELNAAVVAEGAPKPLSGKTLAQVTSVVRTIAHLFKLSRQSWEDVPGLQALINNNGIYGVQLAEDDELLNGSGVAPHLDGFMKNAVAAPAPPDGTGAGAPNLIDAVGTAIFDLASKGYLPDGIVVNPADWGGVALLKNQQGNYLFSNPIDYSTVPRIWGSRIVMSSKMTAGNFLVGAFTGNSLLLDREEVNVQVATQNNDDFEKNMVTVRIEERIALMIFNATAFEKGVTPAVTP